MKKDKSVKKAGILLGGGIYENGSMPEDAKRRAERSYGLLKDGKIRELILSGKGLSKKEGHTEAEAYARYLMKKGIRRKDLILERVSMDTIGNAVYSKKICLRKKFPKRIILITSDYHMKRALMIFRHIFGKGYSFIGEESKAPVFEKPRLKRRDWEHKEIDELLLLDVLRGDHKKAERLIKKLLPQYR